MAHANEQEGAGKLAFVTGASTGIGWELAKVFAKKGYDVAIVSDEEAIHDRAQDLRAYSVEVWSYCSDLAQREEVEQLYESVKEIGRPIDIIALNAGVGVSGRFVNEIPLEDDLHLISLNISSIVHLAKIALPQMVDRNSGKVLITSSIAALMPGPFYATYAASKSFLLSFSEALHNELKEFGVTVTALMPGATDTQFFERAGMQDTKVARAQKDDPADVAEQGYKALMNGESHVIAGSFGNKIEGFMTNFLSEQMKAGMQRDMTEPDYSERNLN